MVRKIVYPERESKHLEFKSTIPKLQSLVKTCIAFANGSGGQIIIGVNDKTREIVGITDAERDRLYDEFPNSLYDSTSPNLFARIYEKNFDGKSVLIIEIPPSFKKPYFLKKEGVPSGVYLRIGASMRRANREYVEDLIREGRRISFDEEAAQSDIDSLSKELLHRFYGKRPSERRLLSDKVLVASSAHAEKNLPTIAGIVMFCDTPHQFIPESIVICTRFSGKNGRNIIQTEEITGCLEDQAQTSFNLIKSWLGRGYKLSGIKMRGNSLIPDEALREAIINSLVHRKYSIPGATKIALYDDHLEIFNPGCFPGLVDINMLGDGTTYLRNPIIARIAHKTGLIEKLGTGIRLIFDSCKKAGIRAPRYNEDGDFVKVTFYFEKERDLNMSDSDAILQLGKDGAEFSINDVINLMKVSRNTATRRVNKLISEKKLIRSGKGPSVRFKKP